MDLNMNKLPETDDSRLKPNTEEPPLVQPEPRDPNALLKVAGFLAVVVVLTGLAINSHQGTPATMASDTPPPVAGASTMPTISAPTDRTTTGSAASSVPTMAPNPPSEAAEGKNSNQ